MGKEWYWSSRSSSTKKGPFSQHNNSKQSSSSAVAATSGCMSAVFHFFDFHHFQFPLNHNHNHHTQPPSASSSFSLPLHDDYNTLPKGVEAPRNSLELDQNPFSTNFKGEVVESLKFPTGIQIRTRPSSNSNYDSSSSADPIISSPSAKTPTLVARLMGLDLLPETTPSQSPSPTTLKLKLHHKKQSKKPRTELDSRSLPETPRVSSARRSDVDIYHHRLSLQNNEDYDFAKIKRRELKTEEENRSPRQIVKQIKENMSRRFGVDVTNSLVNNQPRLSRFVEQKQRVKTEQEKIHKTRVKIEEKQSSQQQRPNKKCNKKQQRIRNNNKQEEPFVRNRKPHNSPDKNSKKTPLSNDLFNVHTLLPVKIAPATKLPPKQVCSKRGGRCCSTSQLSSTSSQISYKQEPTKKLELQDINNNNIDENRTRTNGVSNTVLGKSEHEYITSILNRTSTTQSSPHRLNPSIFHDLETSTIVNNGNRTGQLSLLCNRKLMFDLVDEVLSEILTQIKPPFNLFERLCFVIDKFPNKDCRVLEDIDGLIGIDLEKLKPMSQILYQNDGVEVVSEIETDILNSLIDETVTFRHESEGITWRSHVMR